MKTEHRGDKNRSETFMFIPPMFLFLIRELQKSEHEMQTRESNFKLPTKQPNI